MSSATEELRALLDERGVKWKAWDGVQPITVWHDETYSYEFVEYHLVNGAKQVSDCPSDNDGHCELTIKVYNCTPEQAVAATLGSSNCTNDCTNSERTETCRRVRGRKSYRAYGGYRIECSACGYGLADKRYRFCPSCGRKVVDE